MNQRTTEAEEDNDARLNLLYRADKIKSLLLGCRGFRDTRQENIAREYQRRLISTLEEMREWFAESRGDK